MHLEIRSKASFLALLLVVGLGASGCTAAKTTGKVILTPIAAVRDTVDIPLTGAASFMERGAQRTRDSFGDPRAGVGYGLGGLSAGFGLDLSYGFAKGASYLFGGLDYALCRSFFPNTPNGVSPWKKKEESWGSHLFPTLKGMWGEYKPERYNAVPPSAESGS